MPWISILSKKTKTPQKCKKNNLMKAKRILDIKMSAKKPQFLHLSCQEGGSPPCPLPVMPLRMGEEIWKMHETWDERIKKLDEDADHRTKAYKLFLIKASNILRNRQLDVGEPGKYLRLLGYNAKFDWHCRWRGGVCAYITVVRHTLVCDKHDVVF